MKVKTAVFLCVLAMLLSACGSQSGTEESQVIDQSGLMELESGETCGLSDEELAPCRESYEKVLRENYQSDRYCFALPFVDGDGYPELVVGDSEQGGMYLYTWDGEEIEGPFDAGDSGVFTCYESQGIYYAGAFEGVQTYMSLSGGESSQSITFFKSEEGFFVNDAEVTEEAYKNARSEYFENLPEALSVSVELRPGSDADEKEIMYSVSEWNIKYVLWEKAG